MLKHSIVPASCTALLAALAVHAAPAHVHGIATLDVVVEGQALDIELESPLDNLVGFEHAPRTSGEIAAVRAMARQFAAAKSMFAPSPAARCALKSVRLSSAVIDPQLLTVAASPGQPATEAEQGKDDGDGHAELNARVSYRCEQPASLKRLETGVFAAFPRMVGINAQVAASGRQFAAKLAAGQNAITF
jgi:hypothetical protein